VRVPRAPAVERSGRPDPEPAAEEIAAAGPGGGGALATARDVAAGIGRAVTLAALLAVAAAIGGLADGQPAQDTTPLTITFEP
jgi:hypothetical protein